MNVEAELKRNYPNCTFCTIDKPGRKKVDKLIINKFENYKS